MNNVIQGRAWKYGDNVNTDVIFPGKYTYTITDRAGIAQHALEDLDPRFASNVQPGDVIVAGRNWGCGSSREQAATCLAYNGVGAIIAESFGRIFYRNALNQGLLAIVCVDAARAIEQGDDVIVNLAACRIHCRGVNYSFPRLSSSIMGIIEAGGIVPYVKQKLSNIDVQKTL